VVSLILRNKKGERKGDNVCSQEEKKKKKENVVFLGRDQGENRGA